jgi:hypothetical protein
MLGLTTGFDTPSALRDLCTQAAGMDEEVYAALRAEGWVPPGHVPVLLTREEAVQYLKPCLPPVNKDHENMQLPAPDARIADQAVWLLRTIDRFIAERKAVNGEGRSG